MEQEVRQILQHTVAPTLAGEISFAERVNRKFANLDAAAVPMAERQITRTPPEFDKP